MKIHSDKLTDIIEQITDKTLTLLAKQNIKVNPYYKEQLNNRLWDWFMDSDFLEIDFEE